MANDNKSNKPTSTNEAGDNKGNRNRDNRSGKTETKKKHLVRVRFDRSYTPYLKGEIAGLEPKLAEQLIKDKICSKI